VDELFVREARIAAERAMPFLGRGVQNLEAIDFVANGFGGAQSERFCQRVIQAQDAISGVVHDDEIGNGVEIFDPLLA
jgi:hypothetical protein